MYGRSDEVKVKVSARHMEVSEPLSQYAQQKAGKLDKYFDQIREVEVVVEKEGNKSSVEMIVNADHTHRFVAKHDNGDAYACIDACVDKLERQLHEHKDKQRNRKHLAGEDKHTRG
jgi:putative sigma-54 modulation protein